MIFSPLEQFNVLSVFDFSLSFDSLIISVPLFAFFLFFFDSFVFTFFDLFSNLFFFLFPFSFFSHSFFFSLFLSFLSFFWHFFFFVSSFDSLSLFFSFNLFFFDFFSFLYFFFFEFFLSFFFFFYSFTLHQLFSLSLHNFSFLIFSFNTSTIWLSLGAFLFFFLFSSSCYSVTVVAKNSWQSFFQLFYLFLFNIVQENAGPSGKSFFPLIFTTFTIVLFGNLLGMIPYSFTVTSHLIVTFCTALAIFSGLNILGLLKHRKHFLSLFFPPGAPLALAPLLVLIEFISYVFRILSLSIRLFANLMSGHTLLKILATFSWGVVSFWGLFFWLPAFAIILIVTGLEMAIACLQAYIFAVLLCIYLNDAFNLH